MQKRKWNLKYQEKHKGTEKGEEKFNHLERKTTSRACHKETWSGGHNEVAQI